MSAALSTPPGTTARTRGSRPELELCANPDCGRPYPPDEGFGGVCDPCSARETEHLADGHADPDPECRFCA
ncbi:hypothetical protein GCM10027047_26420 [Rhodococcus aerolatus]